MHRVSAYRSSPSRRLYRFFQHLVLGFWRSPTSKKVLYISVFFGTCVLFFPWVSLELKAGSIEHYSSFHMIAGGIGFFILAIFGMLLFLLSYVEDREGLKTKTNIIFREHSTIVLSGLLIGALCTMIFISLLGFSRLTTGNVIIDTRTSGIVFEILIAILIIFAGVLNYREGRANISKHIYIENASSEYARNEHYDQIIGTHRESKKESNMKLPI